MTWSRAGFSFFYNVRVLCTPEFKGYIKKKDKESCQEHVNHEPMHG
jgi:hypothetical protein